MKPVQETLTTMLDLRGLELGGGQRPAREVDRRLARDLGVAVVLRLEVAGVEDLLDGDHAGPPASPPPTSYTDSRRRAAVGPASSSHSRTQPRDHLLVVPIGRKEALDGEHGRHGLRS